MFGTLNKTKVSFKAWVLGLAFLSTSLLSIQIPNFEIPPHAGQAAFAQYEGEFSNLLKQGDKNRASQYGYDLAQKYLDHRRPQEAIWTLRKAGHSQEARQVHTALEKLLLNSATFRESDGGGAAHGVAAKTFYKNAGGIKAVAKWWNQNGVPDIRYEIVAYEIDKLAGFDIVPLTVKRRFGNRDASAQYFVKDAKETGINLRDQAFNEKTGLRIHTLDLILGNYDRHWQNWLFRPGRLPVAIDHSHVKPHEAIPNHLSLGIDDSELRRIARLLANLTPERVQGALSPLITQAEIDSINRNISKVVNWYKNNGFQVEARNIPEAAPQRAAAERRPALKPPAQGVQLHPMNRGADPAPKPQKRKVTLNEFDDVARIARRSQSERERSSALKEVIKILSDREWRGENLRELAKSKRVAHLIEASANKFPIEVLQDYKRALSRLANREEAHLRAEKQCKAQLARMGAR